MEFCSTSVCFSEFILFSFDMRVWENQRPNVHVMILQHIAIKWDSNCIPRFWKNTTNTLKATWLKIIAYELSFKTMVYEMFFGVCLVWFLILRKENKCHRNCWGLLCRTGTRETTLNFSCCSPGKRKDCLSGLGFDLVFASEMSRIEYMNYAEDNPI